MRCPSCLREHDPRSGRCDCPASPLPSQALVPVQGCQALAQVDAPPLSLEARLANNLSQGFDRLISHPRLAQPLQLTRRYWPVAAIPAAATVVGIVGVKTSLGLLGSALLWGMSLAIQLLGNM